MILLQRNYFIIAWVRSRLEYASVVWSPHTKRNINNLEQVQRRATRFILGRDYSEYERLSKLRGSLPKSGPLEFATKNSFPLFFVGEEALVCIY